MRHRKVFGKWHQIDGVLRFLNRQFFVAETGVYLSEDCNRSCVFRLNRQSLLQDCARGGERSGRTRGIAFCSRNHRLKPGFGVVEAVVDVLEVFARRSGKHPLCFGKISVDQCQKYSKRSLSAAYVHVGVFRQHLAQFC